VLDTRAEASYVKLYLDQAYPPIVGAVDPSTISFW
jgi:hypothetical protein